MQANFIKRFFMPEHMVKPDKRLGDLPDTKTAYQDVMRIAFPSLIEMVLMSMIGAVDTAMVGFLGEEAIAAVTLPGQPRMIFMCLFFAMNVGVTAIIARRKGEERQADANTTLRNAMMLVLGMAMVLMTIAISMPEAMMRLAGANTNTPADARVLKDSTDYFRIMSYAMPINALAMCICAGQRGIGNTKITMVVNVASNLINMVFNYLLIGGNFGFPRLEVRGAAIASVIGMACGALFALGTVLIGGKWRGYLHISRHDSWRINKDAMKSIIKIGGNAAVEQVGVRFGFFIYARIMYSLGTVMYAAHGIGMQFINITFTFGDGLGVAATSLVGQNLGRKRADLSMLYGKVAQRVALMISVILAAILITFRYQLPGLFLDSTTPNAEQVIYYAAQALMVLAFIQPFQTSSVVLSSGLRGAGDNLYVAMVATICVSIVRPVLAALAVYVFHFELGGAWVFGLFELVLRFMFFYPRFSSGKWASIKV